MEKNNNRFIAVDYKLYSTTDGKRELIEETSKDKPFVFISGMGVSLDAFEEKIIPVEKGQKFEFTLAPEQAYGEFVAERVLQLGRDIFTVDGKFDSQNIYKDAIVPMQNEDGNKFFARVLEITDDNVKMDFNHPLAGKELTFEGEILENRDATLEEMKELVEKMNGGCGGSCGGNCGGGCHSKEGKCKDGDCGCGKCN